LRATQKARGSRARSLTTILYISLKPCFAPHPAEHRLGPRVINRMRKSDDAGGLFQLSPGIVLLPTSSCKVEDSVYLQPSNFHYFGCTTQHHRFIILFLFLLVCRSNVAKMSVSLEPSPPALLFNTRCLTARKSGSFFSQDSRAWGADTWFLIIISYLKIREI
jgi:hypothetical protein